MSVRGKFTVTELTFWQEPFATAPDQPPKYWETGRKVILMPVYDPNSPEDQRYAKATPSGKIEMHIDNPAAIVQFPIGAQFYVDFTPIEKG